MKNPNRIDRILKLLKKLWKTMPEQRFGQLLENYLFNCEECIFYKEDDEIEKELKMLLGEPVDDLIF